MRRGSFLLALWCLASCQDSDDAASGEATSSSEAGTTDVSATTTMTTTSPADTSSDTTTAETTCAEACATESGSSSNATTESSGSESSSGAPESSSSESSSEGPAAVCGNGVVEAGEDCDDSVQTATCDDDCTVATCGDAHVNGLAGEACDAGGESFGCDNDCTAVVCGDGLVNASANETCDDSGESASCDDNCTAVDCGDGTQNLTALETCDDGNEDSGDGCSSNCVIEGDFGGVCRVVDGTQWCFDNDHCGEACQDVCTSLGLTLSADDAAWFAAQDTAGECQAISDAFGLAAPIDFGNHALGCLEDSGLNALTGGGLTGGLLCSSDPMCPAAHHDDMDNLGVGCDLVGARRSVCPCEGEFCGNGVVEGAEVCDDGNQIENDGCTTACVTTPPTCVVVDSQMWCFNNDACGEACNDVCSALGLSLDITDDAWFALQDEAAECQAISDALGLVSPIQMNSWTYGCLEDDGINDTVGGGLTGALYCSTYNGCPGEHRTNMDNFGTPCGPGGRRSICPCN